MRNILIAFVLLMSTNLLAQDTIIIDQIIARVGDEIILQSEVEGQYFQWLAEGNSASPQAKCQILEAQLIQKLLINQAKIDSIEITDDELQMQVDSRINMYVSQIGGEAELEKYLNKSIFDIKNDMKKVLKNQLIAERVQDKITEDVSITPSDVAEYYATIPYDSLPLIDVTFEIRQISFYPQMTTEEEQATIDKLTEIRDKIVSGTRKFESMARMYSEDPGSATNGGEIGFFGRADLDPTFAAVAFNLEKDEVSEIVKSEFGYHIIQLIERRGERVNVRHILIKPIIPAEAKIRALDKADSVLILIQKDSLDFSEAAAIYSEDENTKNNGGLVFNLMTGSTKFKIGELPPYIKYDIINLANGEISEPKQTTDASNNSVIKIYYIESKTPEHVANLSDDYQLIHDMAMAKEKERVFNEWIKEQQQNVYISIDEQYKGCKFRYNNWMKNQK
ncbi:MAG: peptidylprolyl isomerase [Bacteroidales bacterium]|nr:peptidylprolyl isomerase [Bacteroidales bacterium]